MQCKHGSATCKRIRNSYLNAYPWLLHAAADVLTSRKSEHFQKKEQEMTNQEEDLSATELVTSALCEELQLSGEKDRLKNMLLEDLRTHGWTEVMFKVAGKATATAMHQAETESVGSGASKTRQSLSAFQLAQRIAKTGHGKLIFASTQRRGSATVWTDTRL